MAATPGFSSAVTVTKHSVRAPTSAGPGPGMTGELEILGHREERAFFAALLAAACKPVFPLGPPPGLKWEPEPPRS